MWSASMRPPLSRSRIIEAVAAGLVRKKERNPSSAFAGTGWPSASNRSSQAMRPGAAAISRSSNSRVARGGTSSSNCSKVATPVEGLHARRGRPNDAGLCGNGAERWLVKFGHCYKWNILPDRGTFGVDQERE